jgi:SPX domain protein involved in polyphosphate accumulation/uncharacterized membrane protein YidH (DUF202 family)
MVKFGHYLLEAVEQTGIDASNFFDYKPIKKSIIKKLIETKTERGHAMPEQTYEFADILDQQITKIRGFIQKTTSELDRQLQDVMAEEAKERANPKSTKGAEYFLQAANRLGEEFVRLSSFVAINKLGIDKIIKKHDKHACMPFREIFPFFLQERALLHTSFFDPQILALSDFYAKLRGEVTDKNVGVGTNFERQSIKYWVHPQDAMTVIMIIIQHLPVYSFKPDDKGDFKRKCISDINSTYYDNERLYMYHKRIERQEGASLIRIRWYDNKDTVLFVERKIHHESWVQETSTKERFILPSRKIDSFIAGEYLVADFMEELKKKPKLSPEELAHQKELFEEVQKRFTKYDLFPSVRTHYMRMAFQIPGDASVRISLDLDVEMMTEWLCPAGHWRTERPDGELTYHFPYVIMEVKLQGSLDLTPAWAKDLMNSKFCEAVPKFSKFGHGTATLHPDRITIKPYWFDQMNKEIESIYKPDRGTHMYREFRPPAKPSVTPQPVSVGLGVPRAGTPNSNDQSDDERSDDGHGVSHPSSVVGLRHRRIPAGQRRVPWWLRSSDENRDVADELSRIPDVQMNVRIEPKTYLANERTFLHWLSIASLVAMMALAILRRPGAAPLHPVTAVVGSSAFMCSVVYMLYALVTFVKRGRLISQGKPIRLDDSRGPVVLTLMLISVVVVGSLARMGVIASARL